MNDISGETSRLTDEQLFDRFRNHGDHPAFNALVERFERPFLAQTMRRVSDSATAKDLVQECFLVAIRKRHSFVSKGEGSLFSWLFGILHNDILRELSRRKLTTNADESLASIRGCDKGAEKNVQDNELLDMVFAELDNFEDEQRQVILLRFEGLGYKAIAKYLDCSEVAARQIYSRTVKLLRKRLG